MSLLAVENATMLVEDELRVITRGYLLIRDGIIEEYGEGSAPVEGALDAKDTIIIPGLINCHTHIGDSAFKEYGVAVEHRELMFEVKPRLLNSIKDKDLVHYMRESMLEMLHNGIVAFADFREGGVKGVRLLQKAAKGLPIRPIVFGRPSKLQMSLDELQENRRMFSDGEISEIEEVLDYADGISISYASMATDGMMKQLHEAAARKGKKTAIHASEAEYFNKESLEARGETDVKRIVRELRPNFVVHMTNALPDDINLVVKNNISIAACPRANCKTGVGVPPMLQMVRKKAVVGLGTDNVMLNTPDLFAEMDFTSKMVRGTSRSATAISPYELLRMATIDGSRAIGIDGELGSITRGKEATMVFIDARSRNLHPVVDPIATVVHRVRPENIRAVLVKGEIAVGDL